MGLRARIISFFLRAKAADVSKGIDEFVNSLMGENPTKVVSWINAIGSMFGKKISKESVNDIKVAYGYDDNSKNEIKAMLKEMLENDKRERRNVEDHHSSDKVDLNHTSSKSNNGSD